ncbi:oxidase ustYa family protein [Aspergillus vadensis CBS 113365]|uniref:Tat pathway signal sequence n=1 Tax=Aspergillus vadensis (strain CBS 113365 / IMI 142717 / IBT 24658) TaxID=1448311 RepID=A0A319B6W3_ASPVC|nr:hypothetical protein BO88DRAFT_454238 [Aspergillus vadensis CBS 113365]PYH68546.1 hypothetical protein BO88DRAFT_454238 [Aspergillus vadensis CBS 113365]
MSLARLSTMYMALRRDRTDSTSSSSEILPLSDSSEDYRDESFKDHFAEGHHYTDHQRQPHVRWSSLCFHLILALIYGAAFLAATYRSTNSIRHQDSKPAHLIASPLWEAIELERKTINASIESENPFKGAPSEELDHAWHQLFINSNIRVTAEDLAKINRTSVPISDEKGGYYAIPDVYHQLHCLKFLRQVVYHSYYHIGKPTTPLHIEHCIDNLRQNIMCKADISLLTFTWDSTDRAPKPNFVIEHECANWDKVDKWAEEHRFDIFDETTLVHPTLGPSFPEEEYKATGRIPGHPDFHPNGYHGDHR